MVRRYKTNCRPFRAMSRAEPPNVVRAALKDDQRVIGKMNVQTEYSIEQSNIVGVGNDLDLIELQAFSYSLILLKISIVTLFMKIANTNLTRRLVFASLSRASLPDWYSLRARFMSVGMPLKRKASDAGTLSRARRRIESITDYCDASPRTDALGSISWPASGEAMEDARKFIRAW